MREKGRETETAHRVGVRGARSRRRRRLALAAALLVILGAFAVDASRPPAQQVSAAAAVRLVHGYQHTLSPALGRLGIRCRFTPSCSHYAEAVLRKHGSVEGTWLAVQRIARCGPWTPAGTIDPPK
jgi:putative membrane protein insertion efficiency factor